MNRAYRLFQGGPAPHPEIPPLRGGQPALIRSVAFYVALQNRSADHHPDHGKSAPAPAPLSHPLSHSGACHTAISAFLWLLQAYLPIIRQPALPLKFQEISPRLDGCKTAPGAFLHATNISPGAKPPTGPTCPPQPHAWLLSPGTEMSNPDIARTRKRTDHRHTAQSMTGDLFVKIFWRFVPIAPSREA
eukprot:CAMPEP_0113526828 /NCGR_PEP_ID=MMETSP0015_2-20120614/959_1 /TAXON_ID=2838 /ORGANISM="Odontella" /LENGTH=188 /DNA_ID=CAMNT_0000425199 /DNA_START=121 /DNA_END=688 /DNA_ORIENTATION=+ /assembly_acc=CAM_ASM_000160